MMQCGPCEDAAGRQAGIVHNLLQRCLSWRSARGFQQADFARKQRAEEHIAEGFTLMMQTRDISTEEELRAISNVSLALRHFSSALRALPVTGSPFHAAALWHRALAFDRLGKTGN